MNRNRFDQDEHCYQIKEMTIGFTIGRTIDEVVEMMYEASVKNGGADVFATYNGVKLGPVNYRQGDKSTVMTQATQYFWNNYNK